MSLLLKIARRIPPLRKLILRGLYRKKGIHLEELVSLGENKFFLYRIKGAYLPGETLHTDMSLEWMKKKALNESMHFYQPGENDVVIDLGAGLGEETLIYSRLVGKGGRVVSVEANPQVHNALAKMVRLNQLDNVTLCRQALGPENGRMTLTSPAGSYESGFVSTQREGHDEVESVTLVTLMKNLHVDHVDLLKANIEGAERFIINELPAEYFARIRNVAIACHDFRLKKENNEFFRTRELVKSALKKNGFTIRQRQTGIDYLDDWVYGSRNFA